MKNFKDKVVLSKEEWETVCNNISNAESQGRKINNIYGQCLIENQILKEQLAQVRKETAREILKIIKREYDYIGNLERIMAEEYGVGE